MTAEYEVTEGAKGDDANLLEASSVKDTTLLPLPLLLDELADNPPFSMYNCLNFFNRHEFFIFLISGLNEELGVARAYNIFCCGMRGVLRTKVLRLGKC